MSRFPDIPSVRNRYYDPQTAQFLNADSLAALTKAIYSYANSDPLNKMDPLGLSATQISEDDGGTGCASPSNSYNSYISGPTDFSSVTGCVTSFDTCTDQAFAAQGGGKSWKEIQKNLTTCRQFWPGTPLGILDW
ncbi:RHS repeat-associated core domain-containing protein [Arthrobacter sp. efr-133-R2A-63]|uniref:RHS repeat-associated core domain-containing protein n=1 Tax=unclassified Arthrobacter TaxID=235627 RepID=UPI003306F50A